ncbi:MAG TPA: ABC transporter substrate-binding protein [Candidatus Limnocylindrales bacterium]
MNKRIVTILGALVIVVGACSSSGATQSAGSSGGAAPSGGSTPYISIVSKGFQHQFWQAVKKGAEDEAAKEGATVNFMGPDTEQNVDQQLNMLQTELAKKPAALCFAALDSKAATPLLQQFQSQKIPVIAFDSGVDSDIPLTTVATDNVAAAALAADKMAAAIGNSGKVGVIIHDQTSRTGIDRSNGFVDEMKTKFPNIQIIGPQYGGGDQAKSADLAKAMFQANPDIKGFFGGNEGSIIGVLNAVDELKLNGKLTVIGYDSGQKQIDSIKAGTELGAVQQNPIGIGAKCVEYAMKAIKGETGFPKVVDTGFIWADKSNIDSAEVQAVLYK